MVSVVGVMWVGSLGVRWRGPAFVSWSSKASWPAPRLRPSLTAFLEGCARHALDGGHYAFGRARRSQTALGVHTTTGDRIRMSHTRASPSICTGGRALAIRSLAVLVDASAITWAALILASANARLATLAGIASATTANGSAATQ
jgi:hypothetical protein